MWCNPTYISTYIGLILKFWIQSINWICNFFIIIIIRNINHIMIRIGRTRYIIIRCTYPILINTTLHYIYIIYRYASMIYSGFYLCLYITLFRFVWYTQWYGQNIDIKSKIFRVYLSINIIQFNRWTRILLTTFVCFPPLAYKCYN